MNQGENDRSNTIKCRLCNRDLEISHHVRIPAFSDIVERCATTPVRLPTLQRQRLRVVIDPSIFSVQQRNAVRRRGPNTRTHVLMDMRGTCDVRAGPLRSIDAIPSTRVVGVLMIKGLFRSTRKAECGSHTSISVALGHSRPSEPCREYSHATSVCQTPWKHDVQKWN